MLGACGEATSALQRPTISSKQALLGEVEGRPSDHGIHLAMDLIESFAEVNESLCELDLFKKDQNLETRKW